MSADAVARVCSACAPRCSFANRHRPDHAAGSIVVVAVRRDAKLIISDLSRTNQHRLAAQDAAVSFLRWQPELEEGRDVLGVLAGRHGAVRC